MFNIDDLDIHASQQNANCVGRADVTAILAQKHVIGMIRGRTLLMIVTQLLKTRLTNQAVIGYESTAEPSFPTSIVISATTAATTANSPSMGMKSKKTALMLHRGRATCAPAPLAAWLYPDSEHMKAKLNSIKHCQWCVDKAIPILPTVVARSNV